MKTTLTAVLIFLALCFAAPTAEATYPKTCYKALNVLRCSATHPKSGEAFRGKSLLWYHSMSLHLEKLKAARKTASILGSCNVMLSMVKDVSTARSSTAGARSAAAYCLIKATATVSSVKSILAVTKTRSCSVKLALEACHASYIIGPGNARETRKSYYYMFGMILDKSKAANTSVKRATLAGECKRDMHKSYFTLDADTDTHEINAARRVCIRRLGLTSSP